MAGNNYPSKPNRTAVQTRPAVPRSLLIAAAGVLVYIFTGHDWVQVDLYAVYMLAGYFAVTWLGIGARRVYHNAMEGTEKKK